MFKYLMLLLMFVVSLHCSHTNGASYFINNIFFYQRKVHGPYKYLQPKFSFSHYLKNTIINKKVFNLILQ